MFCLLELSRAFSTELCVLSGTNGGFDKVDGTARMKDQPSISGAPAHSSDNSCLQQGKALFSPQISYHFQQKNTRLHAEKCPAHQSCRAHQVSICF